MASSTSILGYEMRKSYLSRQTLEQGNQMTRHFFEIDHIDLLMTFHALSNR